MRQSRLGALSVSCLGLGCMGMSEAYGGADEAEAIATLHAAVDGGCTFWDTADIYGNGANEELVGRALDGRRDQVVLATKFGFRLDRPGEVDGSPAYVRAAMDASLRRLGVEHVDLWYLHRLDPAVPVEETVGAMADVVREGKARHLGLSEVSGRTARAATAVHPIAAVQSEWSLWTRDPEDEVLPSLRELGVGFVPFSPLGRGFLTGQIRTPDDFAPDDMRRGLPRFSGENFQRNLDLVDAVRDLAGTKGVTAGQIALAWLLAHGDDIVPIPGTRQRDRLRENLAAAEVALTPAELASLDEVFAPDAVAGDRYGEAMMRLLDRDDSPQG